MAEYIGHCASMVPHSIYTNNPITGCDEGDYNACIDIEPYEYRRVLRDRFESQFSNDHIFGELSCD